MKLDPKALEAAQDAFDASAECQPREHRQHLCDAITAYLSNLQPSKEVRELVEELRAGLQGVTPGPWYSDTIKSDGCYGTGDDVHEGFDSYAVYSETVERFGSPAAICDAINSDTGSIEEEFDEDGHNAWDEQARKNLAHIARCSPDKIKLLLDALSADLLSRMDGEGWRPKVKALEWRDARGDGTLWARGADVDYVVSARGWGYRNYPDNILVQGGVEAAKAAAQADFDRRILSALAPSIEDPTQGSPAGGML